MFIFNRTLKNTNPNFKYKNTCPDFLAFLVVVGLFWLNWVGLPPVVLDPNILSKRVETGPTAT